MTRRLLATSAALASLLVLSACGGDDPLSDDGGSSEDKGTLVLGGQDFPEMQIMASMYQQLLEESGYTVEAELVGTRDVYIQDLQDGNIDMVPEYAGSITDELQARANGANAPQVSSSDIDETITALNELLNPLGLVALDPAEATDQNAFAVTEQYATENNLTTLSDLGELGEPITLAAAEDCAKRPDCAIGLENVYGIEIEEVLPLGFATRQTKDSVIEGESQLGLVGTSDGSLEQLGLVILEDDQGLQVSQNLVPVVSQETLDANPDIEETLNALSDVLTTEDLAQMNAAVDLERQKPDDVAQAYLEEQGLLG